MAVKIKYNDKIIKEISSGEYAIVKCKGKEMRDDIEVVAEATRYDGAVTITGGDE